MERTGRQRRLLLNKDKRKQIWKIFLVNGPNLDMLGVREPAVYGSNTLADSEKLVVDYSASKGVSVECYQSNHEGCLIDKIHEA